MKQLTQDAYSFLARCCAGGLQKFLYTTAAVLLLLPAVVSAQARYSPTDVGYIVQRFQQTHLSRQTYDKRMASATLHHFFNMLDANRLYFLNADIKEFKRASVSLSKDLRKGKLDIAMAVHQRFMERLDARNAFIENTLKKPMKLPSQTLVWLDRSEANWPKTNKEAEHLWRTRLYTQQLEEKFSGKSQKEVLATLRRRYRSIQRRYQQMERNDITSMFLNAFALSYDPHSGYLNPDDLDNFNIAMRLSLEGIGATLRWEDGRTTIVAIVPGGAAARQAFLKSGDRIIGVAQGRKGKMEDVTLWRLEDVVKRIRGKRGTTVRLRFLRPTKKISKPMEISIRRDKIQLRDSEAKSSVHQISTLQGKVKVGVLTLPSFYQDFEQKRQGNRNYKSSTRDVKKLLVRFIAEKVGVVVLDLRGNSGGALDESIKMSNLFLPKGVMVQVRDLQSVSRFEGHQPIPLYQGPLVLLTDRFSASASEIVAGALKDYGRAVIVGDRATFGKGTVQNIIPLKRNLGALRTTVAQFYRPANTSTQQQGVSADVVLPSINNHLRIGESALENPLPWDSLQSKNQLNPPKLDGFIARLRTNSKKRQQSSPYFKKIQSNIREYLSNRKNKQIITLEQFEAEYQQFQSSRPENPNPQRTTNTLQEDPHLREALSIAADYFQLLQKQKPQATKQAQNF